MAEYTNLPASAQATPKPFTAHVSDKKLKDMLDLVRLSPIGAATYENQDAGRTWGMTRDWLANAKDQWLTKFDWRAHEKRINSFPNYTLEVEDEDGVLYDMHFISTLR